MPRIALAIVLTLSSAIGCGKSEGPELTPTSGLVLLDDKPLEGAAVMFMLASGGPASTGVTDANGRFELKTSSTMGAVVGVNHVTIAKQEIVGLVNGAPGPKGVKTNWIVPQKYSKASTSELTADVAVGASDFEFKLQSSP